VRAPALATTVLLLTSLPGAAPAGRGEPSAPASARFRLPSGLLVTLREDHRVPTVAVNVWYRVGSADEPPGRSGLAHLFEHLMFMGTRALPEGELDRVVEAAGGDLNATTDEDRTSYLDTGPARLLETFLFLEADRMATLPEAMTPDKLARQRAVVEEERQQSYENRPYGQVELILPARLFPPSHPYHHPVIGDADELRAATAEDARAFFHERYAPANAQLAIVGDFRVDEARRLVERYFGWMPPGVAPARPGGGAARLERSESVTVEEGVALPAVTLAFPSPAELSPDDAACELLAAALGSGRSSRLSRALVRGRRLAESVEVEQSGGRLAGRFVVRAVGLPGVDGAALERALDEELARLASHPPDAGELARARALVETALLEHLERGEALAEEMNAWEERFGDARDVGRLQLERYRRVGVEDLARVAREVIVGRPRISVRVVPRAPSPGVADERGRR
jgi:predicted Zn-dependent peptidase